MAKWRGKAAKRIETKSSGGGSENWLMRRKKSASAKLWKKGEAKIGVSNNVAKWPAQRVAGAENQLSAAWRNGGSMAKMKAAAAARHQWRRKLASWRHGVIGWRRRHNGVQ